MLKNPKLGASWEGFAIEQIIQQMDLVDEDIFFWGVHTGADLDLLFQKEGEFFGIEVKYNEAPSLTKSMQSALEELSLKHLWVIYPGDKSYPLAKNVSAVPLQKIEWFLELFCGSRFG